MLKNLSLALSTAAVIALTPISANAETSPFDIFKVSSETSAGRVEFEHWEKYIRRVSVEERGRTLVAYDALKDDNGAYLQNYINYLETLNVSALDKDDQLAFWLNARNILVVKAISEEKSLNGFDSRRGTATEPGDMWTQKRITINGVELSIHDIEQSILLANWDNPDIVFGLYQGVNNTPVLPRTVFVGNKVHAQLELAAKEFLSDKDVLRVRKKDVRLGEFFKLYETSLFNGDQNALLSHLATRAPGVDAISPDLKVKYKSLPSRFESFRPRQQPSADTFDSFGGGNIARGS